MTTILKEFTMEWHRLLAKSETQQDGVLDAVFYMSNFESNTFDTIWPRININMFGHQTMFDRQTFLSLKYR